MTTTTNATINYKISFEKPSVTKGAAESNVKVKNGSYYLLPLQTFHLTFTKKLRSLLCRHSSKVSMKHLHCF